MARSVTGQKFSFWTHFWTHHSNPTTLYIYSRAQTLSNLEIATQPLYIHRRAQTLSNLEILSYFHTNMGPTRLVHSSPVVAGQCVKMNGEWTEKMIN